MQTSDGNIHKLNVSRSGIISDPQIFKVDAPSESGGPVTADLDSDGHIEILSVANNGSLAIIEQDNSSTIRWFNEPTLSPLTQPVTYNTTDSSNEKQQQQVLLAISENGTLLEISNKNNHANTIGNDYNKPLNLVAKSLNFTDILPDARITLSDVDKDGFSEILILSHPVSNYPHGALGDKLEPTELQVIERCGYTFCLRSSITAPQDKVFEAIAPFAFTSSNDDNNKDTSREYPYSEKVALVASDKIEGSNLLIYDIYNSSYSLVYSGEPIGQGFRWMLVLGVVEDIIKGKKIILVNETPHLSGIVKLVDLENGNTTAFETAGFSAHTFGLRNIDMYNILDIDNDQNEDDLIIPNLDKDELNILTLTNKKSVLELGGSLHLSSPLSSNVFSTDIDNDNIPDIIAGDQSGILYSFISG